MNLENIMWNDFDDYSLILLAQQYGLRSEIELDERECLLTNRDHLEVVLTNYEMDRAFAHG